jgi:hypothetical protein
METEWWVWVLVVTPATVALQYLVEAVFRGRRELHARRAAAQQVLYHRWVVVELPSWERDAVPDQLLAGWRGDDPLLFAPLWVAHVLEAEPGHGRRHLVLEFGRVDPSFRVSVLTAYKIGGKEAVRGVVDAYVPARTRPLAVSLDVPRERQGVTPL